MVEVLDYTKALEVLKEYPGDGLHVDTLLDSDSHGALTYNDFLILPGSISKAMITISWVVLSNRTNSLPGIGCFVGNQSNPAVHHQGPSTVFSHGHCDRTQHGHPYGSPGRSGCYPQ
jgi:hypothetical protein